MFLTYKASTCVTYASTMAAMFPVALTDPLWKPSILFLQKESAKQETHQATPASTAQVRDLIKAVKKEIKVAILLIWVTASRYGDIQHMVLKGKKVVGTWVKVNVALPVWKSDLKGQKFASKVFWWPSKLLPTLMKVLLNPPTYPTVYKAMRGVGLTVHSLRRGSMQRLAELGIAEEEILTLTQHSIEGAPIQARRYLNNVLFDRHEAEVQANLSRHLWEDLLQGQILH